MPKLAHLRRVLDGSETRERHERSEELSDAVKSSTEPMTGTVLRGLQALQRRSESEISALKQQFGSDLEGAIAPILPVLERFGEVIGKALEDVEARVSSEIKAIPVPEFSTEHVESQIAALRDAVSGVEISVTDLSAIEGRLSVLEEQIQKLLVEPEPREFEFTFEREDFSDLLKRVKVEELG